MSTSLHWAVRSSPPSRLYGTSFEGHSGGCLAQPVVHLFDSSPHNAPAHQNAKCIPRNVDPFQGQKDGIRRVTPYPLGQQGTRTLPGTRTRNLNLASFRQEGKPSLPNRQVQFVEQLYINHQAKHGNASSHSEDAFAIIAQDLVLFLWNSIAGCHTWMLVEHSRPQVLVHCQREQHLQSQRDHARPARLSAVL